MKHALHSIRSHQRRLLAAALCLALALACLPAPAARAEQPSTFNLLLIGFDSYDPEEPGRSDSMILAQIAPATGDIKLVSFLRDLYVPVPGHGSTRLNAAYFYGGAELLEQTLANSFGVRVDRYMSVNFSLMAELIDQLGGVEVEVSDKELKQLNSILKFYNKKMGLSESDGLLEQSGAQTLTGNQALSFARIRKIDSDFQRVSRQHLVLLGVLKRLTQLDFAALTGLAATNISKVETDIQLGDVTSLLQLLMNASNLRLRSVHVPFDGTYSDATINGMMVLDANLSRNAELISQFLQAE